eukprot:scaffold15150_cov32-Tisochrysis_lutea.AAC.9
MGRHGVRPAGSPGTASVTHIFSNLKRAQPVAWPRKLEARWAALSSSWFGDRGRKDPRTWPPWV